MADDNQKPRASSKSGFLQELASAIGKSLLRAAAILLIAFAIGTGAAALACLYYGLPLWLSLIGGFVVLGISVALVLDS